MHLLKLGVSFLAMGGATYAMIAIKELDPITRVLIWIPSIMAIILMMPDTMAVVEQGAAKAKTFIEEQQRAQRNSLSWRITNSTGTDLNLEFTNYDNSQRWPDARDQVFMIRSGDTWSHTLSCTYTTVICFGIWNQSGTSWGLGQNRMHRGAQSCHTCQGGTVGFNIGMSQ